MIQAPAIRDGAALVDAARADGRIVCGSNWLPLTAYTTWLRDVDPTLLDGPLGTTTARCSWPSSRSAKTAGGSPKRTSRMR